jgi:4-hydroxy-tetrahydrodipicolinate synthase
MTELIEKMNGIIVPLVTPLTAKGSIDEDSLRRLAAFVVDGGVNGVFVMGTTGEFQYISEEQQRVAIQIVVDEVGHRTLVVAGVTGSSIEKTTRNLVIAGKMSKPPHAAVIAPLCYHSNRGLPQHVERLNAITELPILLYNNLGIVTRRWKRKDIIPDIVRRIAHLDNVVGLKDSSGNINWLSQILKNQSPNFRVFQGEESQILAALRLGVVGAVPSIGNIVPDLCAKMYASYLSGDTQAAERNQQAIIAIHDLYLKFENIPRVLKECLLHKGVITTSVSCQPFEGSLGPVMKKIDAKVRALDRLDE